MFSWLAWMFLFASARAVNFVVLFADDMGYGDQSYAGHPTILTPNLDRLAAEGLVLTNWYSAFHVCSPSRAAMMTGRLPIRSGITGGWLGGVFSSTAQGGLPENETTWAESLSRKGYRTMCVGKWHLGQRPEFLPTRRGFDEYLGIPYSVDMGKSAWRDTDQPPLPVLANESVLEQPANLNTLSQRYVAAARSFVEKGGQFALYYAFSHVHVPDFASPQFCNTSRRGRYGDAVAELDWSVGQVAFELPEDTLTIFTSDNGPWLVQDLSGGSAGLFFEGKSTTWEGGVREPGILRWPGVIMPGQRRLSLVSTCDVFSTILSAAGVEPPRDRVIDGVDLAPIFNVEGEVRDCIFIYKGRPMGANQPGLWAVRCGKYKAHYASSYSGATCSGAHSLPNCTGVQLYDPPLLFDVEFDPSEKWPLNISNYKTEFDTISAAKKAHEEALDMPEDQILLGSNDAFAVCGCPNSTLLYPEYPNCTCQVENWLVSICAPLAGSAASSFADTFEASHGWRPY